MLSLLPDFLQAEFSLPALVTIVWFFLFVEGTFTGLLRIKRKLPRASTLFSSLLQSDLFMMRYGVSVCPYATELS